MWYWSRSLSENGGRSVNCSCITNTSAILGGRGEGGPFRVRFFDHLRRVLGIFNENEWEIWPKWAFRSRSSILVQAPRGLCEGS